MKQAGKAVMRLGAGGLISVLVMAGVSTMGTAGVYMLVATITCLVALALGGIDGGS